MDGSAIRRAREKREVSLAALAARMHMSPCHLSRIERGERGLSCDVVACAGRVLGCYELIESCLLECPVYREWVKYRQSVRKVA